jgi:hypothetical protein
MASSHRYQSQLLNFVSRQTRKVLDQTSLLLRHAKVTVIWGTQIVLYPVYAVYQAVRVAGRQLRQTVQGFSLDAQASQLTPPIRVAQPVDLLATDAPIHLVMNVVEAMISPTSAAEPSKPIVHPFAFMFRFFPKFPRREGSIDLQVLGELGDLPLTGTIAPTSTTAIAQDPPLPIQGVASLLTTHHMVLILEGNVVYDILTLEQQHQIQQRIILELASHAHRYKEHLLKGATSTLLPVPPARPTLFAPIRIFRQLMAWIQHSPVALSTNLFREFALNLDPQDPNWFIPQLNPGDFELPKLPSSGSLKASFGQLPRWTDLEALVWAAIHYFFGGRGKRLNSGQAQLPQTQAAQSLTGGAWLSVADVFGYPVSFFQDQPRRSQEPFLAGSGDVATLPAQPVIRMRQTLQQLVERVLKPKSITVLQPRSVQPSAKVVRAQPQTISVTQPRSICLEPPAATPTDWIDTQVTSVDYVKSPWQRFIEWLDGIVYAIETAIGNVWQWLTGQKG